MTIKDVLESVKEHNLSQGQLDDLYDQMVHLHSAYCLELADIKKKAALFSYEKRKEDGKRSVADIKLEWEASVDGQRSIEVKASIDALVKEISALKNRIYHMI